MSSWLPGLACQFRAGPSRSAVDPKKFRRLKSRHGVAVCWVCVGTAKQTAKAPSQNGPKMHRKTLSVAKEDCGHKYTRSRQGRFLRTAHPPVGLQTASRCPVRLLKLDNRTKYSGQLV